MPNEDTLKQAMANVDRDDNQYIPPAPMNARGGFTAAVKSTAPVRITDHMQADLCENMYHDNMKMLNEYEMRRDALMTEMERINRLISDNNIAIEILRNALNNNPEGSKPRAEKSYTTDSASSGRLLGGIR